MSEKNEAKDTRSSWEIDAEIKEQEERIRKDKLKLRRKILSEMRKNITSYKIKPREVHDYLRENDSDFYKKLIEKEVEKALKKAKEDDSSSTEE